MSDQEKGQEQGSEQQQHLDTHLSRSTTSNNPDNSLSTPSTRGGKRQRTSITAESTSTAHSAASSSIPSSVTASTTRRSSRISLNAGTSDQVDKPTASSSNTGGKRKGKASSDQLEPVETFHKHSPSKPSPLSHEISSDRKGKKRAAKSLTPPPGPSSSHEDSESASKRSKRGSVVEGRYSLRRRSNEDPEPTSSASSSKGKAKAKDLKSDKGAKMSKEPSKKSSGRAKRGTYSTPTGGTKKGDSSAKQLIGDDDEDNWMDEPETSRSRFSMGDDIHDDEDMEGSGHEDEDNSDDEMAGLPHLAGRGGMSELARHARESGLLDEATANAIFGSGGFQIFGGMMSGLNNRCRRLRNELRSRSTAKRLAALRECSELLLVSNEDTLGGSFSTHGFATEFIAILNGKPNIDNKADETEASRESDEMDEDAQLAAVLAMSAGEGLPAGFGGDDDEMECQLVACRCLAHLLEALPGSGHTLVHLGAVPALCAKLHEITYIELAEQTLSTLEKISAESPSAIVKEGGLGALLNYLPFFSTNVQRTALTAAANCCRNISTEHFSQVRDVFPILRDVLTQADQRLVEQATLAVVRTIESYKHNASHLEGLLDLPTVVAINSLLMPSGGSPLVTPHTFTLLLRALTTSARGSAKVAIAFLEAGMTNTVYQILTGVLPPAHEESEQGGAEGGQGLSGGVADMAVLQNLAHRPKDQVEESLALVCELLPPLPRDGVFDARSYTEKNLARIKKGRKSERSDRPSRRSARNTEASATPSTSAGPGTPTAVAGDLPPADPPVPTPAALAKENALKQKREQEAQQEQRTEYFKAHPELLAKFIKAILPVLVDVYAASVAMRVRTKVLNALCRAVAFSNAEDLRITLRSVPMASFLCAIISSRDHSTFVLCALQLVELLAVKMPDIYQNSFQREGVVYEIESLAAQELSTAKRDTTSDKEVSDVKKEPESTPPMAGPSSSARVMSAIPDDLKPLFGAPGMAEMSSILMDLGVSAGGPSTPKKSSTIVDLSDANIIRARCLIAKKIFVTENEDDNSASLVLEQIASHVKRLCASEITDAEIRETLREITKHFTAPGQSLSSFELLKSGLVDGLLAFVDIDGTVPAQERRAMLYETFSDTTLSNPSPMTSLIKRLHESLSRLEDFQVETAFNGAPDSSGRSGSSGLSRTIRVRLQAEEGQDVPKHTSALSVTIQAIAPLQALNDYLRPRVADPNYVPGGSLSSMFAAFASGMGGESGMGRMSRLLDAMHNDQGRAGQSGDAAATSSGPEATAEATASKSAGPTPVPTRRRSARLSGMGVSDAEPSTSSGQGTSGSSAPIPIAASTDSNGPTGLSISPEAPIFPSMTMDMDFDDEEGYSEDDYDVEAFEDEMDEEINRPQEKVVNMSVAPDGSRVEAKTPEGTRIATPSQAPASASATGPSGMSLPRTASYAGAVKTTPNDFHLEFTHNGHAISLNDTIYGAIHKYGRGSQESNSSLMYGNTAIIKFRKVDGPMQTSKGAIDAPSPASVVSIFPAGLDSESSTSKILRLLRVLYNLSTEDPNPTIEDSLFVNNKLTAKLTRQLEETMIIASNCLPEWAVELPKHFSFLFPFETRYSFLQSTSFGYGRLIARSQSTQNNRNSRNRDDLSHLARIVRQKVRISRSQLLESCAKVLELYGTSSGILEVEYFDEIGTGLGPTLEFYSIASKEFARRSLNLWRDEDETKAGDYVFHPRGLYPSPINSADTSEAKLGWYKTLGLFTGRALLDSRIIDVNLNNIFLKLILGRPVKRTIANLKHVDMGLARSLERLQSYLHTRKEIEALKLPAGARRNKLMQLTVSGAKLADLSLDFTLPGYDMELKPGGKHIDVDDHNLEEYLDLVLDMTLGNGVAKQVKAFQEGFSMLFGIDHMKIFSADELGLLFGNADEDWSKETLEHAIKADHGYNLDSRSVQNLVEVMSSYDKDQRRQFLQFITGAPKLPIGGFRGLNPPFTVVRKPHEPPFRADDYLPSVMTCAQYLKLPDYSSKDVLAAQIKRAMLDGGGSFHLS